MRPFCLVESRLQDAAAYHGARGALMISCLLWTIDVRHDGSGRMGIVAQLASSRKLDFRQPQTKKTIGLWTKKDFSSLFKYYLNVGYSDQLDPDCIITIYKAMGQTQYRQF